MGPGKSLRHQLWVHHVPVQAQGPAQQFNFSCLGIPFGWNPALAAVSHLSTLSTMSERVSISTEPRDEEEAPAFDQPRRGRGDLPPLDTSDTHSGGSSPPASPGFDPSDSTAALILVHDDEEERDTGFDFAYDSSGEDEDEDDDGVPQGQPAVSPFMTFVYLLSPGLKLGALLLPATAGTTLSRRVTSVVACAALSMIARHVWYMLTRYYWKGAKGDIGRLIIHAFSSTRGSTLARRRYRRIESVLRICRWIVGVLMAGVYVRGE